MDDKRKPVYSTFDKAVQARMKGVGAVSREAAERLAQRGLMPVPGGYTANRRASDAAFSHAADPCPRAGIRPPSPAPAVWCWRSRG